MRPFVPFATGAEGALLGCAVGHAIIQANMVAYARTHLPVIRP